MQQNLNLAVVDLSLLQTYIIDAVRQGIANHFINNAPETNKREETLLNTKDAAKRLKVCTKTITNYIETGKLKAIKFNSGQGKRGHFKIAPSEIEKFIKINRLGY